MYHHGAITLFGNITKGRCEAALRALMALIDDPPPIGAAKEIRVRSWNHHPIEVHPARHLLMKLGFTESRDFLGEGLVYDGTSAPDVGLAAWADAETPNRFDQHSTEQDPVTYDAEQTVALAPVEVREALRGLLELLDGALPDVYELTFAKSDFTVMYRGQRCFEPVVNWRHVRLQMRDQGFQAYMRGILIEPDTDMDSAEFLEELLAQFEGTRREIDRKLADADTRDGRSER